MAAEVAFLFSSTVTRRLSELIRGTSGIDTRVEQLLSEGRELKATWDEVARSVAAAERQQWVTRSEVKRWLDRTDEVLRDLDQFEGRYWEWRDQFRGLLGFLLTCGCPLLCSYGLGARAADLLLRVQELKGQGIDPEDVARPKPFVVVEKLPEPTLRVLGYEGTLAEIRRCLHQDTVGVIGVCGMQGVGKSTLLVAVNNNVDDLVSGGGSTGDGGFGVVVWVDMYKGITVKQLQGKIAKRCGLSAAQLQQVEGDEAQLRVLLFNFLSTRRFLLILNYLWAAFDLGEVGVPRPDAANRSKILFSATSEYVVSEMEADKRIHVDPLNEDDSWQLFRTKVPAAVLDSPSIHGHARALVASCGGLGLAILRVGRTMANKKKPQEWEWARRAIVESPMELRGVSDIIGILLQSFEELSSDLARRCLLHCCSVFRHRDDNIAVEELVDALVEGGLLRNDGDLDDDVEKARATGYAVVGDLKALYLLQPCGDGNDQVKINPMVRSMATHIAKVNAERSGAHV